MMTPSYILIPQMSPYSWKTIWVILLLLLGFIVTLQKTTQISPTLSAMSLGGKKWAW